MEKDIQVLFKKAIAATRTAQKQKAKGKRRALGAFLNTKEAQIILRFLPYIGREPYAQKYGGSYEELFTTKSDAVDRLRELKKERRIERAEIAREVAPGAYRTEIEWFDKHDWYGKKERTATRRWLKRNPPW